MAGNSGPQPGGAVLSLAVLAAVATPGCGQPAASPGRAPAADADAAFAEFQVAFGPLRSTWDFQTGYPRHIFGRAISFSRLEAHSGWSRP